MDRLTWEEVLQLQSGDIVQWIMETGGKPTGIVTQIILQSADEVHVRGYWTQDNDLQHIQAEYNNDPHANSGWAVIYSTNARARQFPGFLCLLKSRAPEIDTSICQCAWKKHPYFCKCG